MFVNLSNNISSPIITKTDLSKSKNQANPDFGETQADYGKQKFIEDSMMDLKELQNFLFLIIGSKIKGDTSSIKHKKSIDLFV